MEDVPKITVKISPMQKLLMYIILPLNVLWCSFLTVVCLPKENNGIKNNAVCSKLTPVKNSAISPDIPIELLKSKSKLMNGTINDVLMTVLSLSLK